MAGEAEKVKDEAKKGLSAIGGFFKWVAKRPITPSFWITGLGLAAISTMSAAAAPIAVKLAAAAEAAKESEELLAGMSSEDMTEKSGVLSTVFNKGVSGYFGAVWDGLTTSLGFFKDLAVNTDYTALSNAIGVEPQ